MSGNLQNPLPCITFLKRANGNAMMLLGKCTYFGFYKFRAVCSNELLEEILFPRIWFFYRIFRFAIQNIPIPTRLPSEANDQLWGGDAIVQGFRKKHPTYKRRVPRFWIPQLKRSVVYSEVLNKYMSVVVTNRAIDMINDNYGFDHYLLKVKQYLMQSDDFNFKSRFYRHLRASCELCCLYI